MGKRGLTQARFAANTAYDERTIRNILKAVPVKDTTLYEVFATLDVDLDDVLGDDPQGQGNVGCAPVHMGAYARQAVDDYIGEYLTIRPAFSGSGNIIAFATAIAWNDAESCLTFEERHRADRMFSHAGQLYIPPNGGFVYFVSKPTKGWLRTVLVSQLNIAHTMRGAILTLHRVSGSMHVPVSAPIVYVKRVNFDGCVLGDLDAGCKETAKAHAEYHRILAETIDECYVRLILPVGSKPLAPDIDRNEAGTEQLG